MCRHSEGVRLKGSGQHERQKFGKNLLFLCGALGLMKSLGSGRATMSKMHASASKTKAAIWAIYVEGPCFGTENPG